MKETRMSAVKKKVLVVDDEADVVKYLCILLEDHGFSTVSAINGKEGMEMAKSTRPDVISLDITMPGETGVRMLRNLKEDPETMHIPVVLVTGVDPVFETFITKYKQVKPPAAFFPKPIDKDAYVNKIKEILNSMPSQ